MTTAITGIKAQASALGYISDNIANSQTTGFKRTEASFRTCHGIDTRNQQPGAVLAQPRYTTGMQGSIVVFVATHMAVNGDGFFVVTKSVGMSDAPLCSRSCPIIRAAATFQRGQAWLSGEWRRLLLQNCRD